jgi:hypothetical protein
VDWDYPVGVGLLGLSGGPSTFQGKAFILSPSLQLVSPSRKLSFTNGRKPLLYPIGIAENELFHHLYAWDGAMVDSKEPLG